MAPPMELVGVGIATIDVIQEIDGFPEDPSAYVEKDTAIAAQLECVSHWLGTTTDPDRDGDAAFVFENLRSFGIDASAATVLPSGAMPVSVSPPPSIVHSTKTDGVAIERKYILANKATGSRTIIHHRDLPELSFESFSQGYTKLVAGLDCKSDNNVECRSLWVHFEGRNLENVEKMIQFLREKNDSVAISLEVEALRNDWGHVQRLLKIVDVAFVSKDYVRKTLGLHDAKALFELLRTLWGKDWRPSAIVCPWGCDGVYYLDVNAQTVHHVSTDPIANTVDSVGAGDSFIGATLAAFTHNVPLHASVRAACRVATAKCKQHGLRLPIELRDELMTSFLKTRKL